MKKIIKYIFVIFVISMVITGCKKTNKYALEFKEEYESLNGVVNKSGKEHRTIIIDKDNPYIKTTPEEIVKMIENNESFYLYVGDALCPWCRSVLEKSIEIAKKKSVSKIYYIDIWDDEGNEILRDKYELVDGKATKTIEGTEAYTKLLGYFKDVLDDYTLTDENGKKIELGIKRIFAPNYFRIKKGKVTLMVDGISEKQTDSREELTKEMLDDEEKEFNSLFVDYCDIDGC